MRARAHTQGQVERLKSQTAGSSAKSDIKGNRPLPPRWTVHRVDGSLGATTVHTNKGSVAGRYPPKCVVARRVTRSVWRHQRFRSTWQFPDVPSSCPWAFFRRYHGRTWCCLSSHPSETTSGRRTLCVRPGDRSCSFSAQSRRHMQLKLDWLLGWGGRWVHPWMNATCTSRDVTVTFPLVPHHPPAISLRVLERGLFARGSNVRRALSSPHQPGDEWGDEPPGSFLGVAPAAEHR